LIGDEANPWAQIGLLLVTLVVLALFTRRRKTSPSDDPWQQGLEGEDLSEHAFEAQSLVDDAQTRRPKTPPSDLMFAALLETPEDMPQSDTIPQIEATTEPASIPQEPMVESQAPALPEGGLPEGWTEEQWSHYGQQYLDAQSSNS
jgi:hypothetical protein